MSSALFMIFFIISLATQPELKAIFQLTRPEGFLAE